jgi:hypothetical protein
MYQNRFTQVGGLYRDCFSEPSYDHLFYTLPMEKNMTQQTTSAYPKTASILALVGGILILLAGALFIAVSVFVLPNISYSNVQVPQGLSPASIPALVSGFVGVMGAFELVSGIIVLISAVMLLSNLGQRRIWGVLILVFSILSFIGFGGFIAGAVLGMVGGILTLRWKPSTF